MIRDRVDIMQVGGIGSRWARRRGSAAHHGRRAVTVGSERIVVDRDLWRA